ncbi:MAG: hypothetical protein V4537_14305 [Pseudomonadota bacterium]
MFAFPKPVKREKKKPRGLRRRRWGVHRKAGGTAHSRRPRELGRMAWLHSLRTCFVSWFMTTPVQYMIFAHDIERLMLLAIRASIAPRLTPCGGWFECAHLFGRYGDGDNFTVLLCRDHHHDVDRYRTWFRSLPREHRVALKLYLAARATAGWLKLSVEDRARWDEIGAARAGRV